MTSTFLFVDNKERMKMAAPDLIPFKDKLHIGDTLTPQNVSQYVFIRGIHHFLHCIFLTSQRPCSGSGSAITSQYPGIIESHDEYRFVERLIPRLQVPEPPKHTEVTPSGWIPPKGMSLK